MYSFVSIENITSFLNNFGLDYSLFTSFEQAIVILLSNILFLIFWFIIISFFYKLLYRFLRIF